jgi:Tol biopolymer transport system component
VKSYSPFGLKPHALLPGFLVALGLFAMACSRQHADAAPETIRVGVFPDYDDITIPPNIASLNFEVLTDADQYEASITDPSHHRIDVRSRSGQIRFPLAKWKKMLRSNAGNILAVDILYKNDGQWYRMKTRHLRVANEPVDPFVAYRLIEPGYETWNKMGIYQRNLENFDEEPVLINTLSDGNCMNCHAFGGNSTRTMMIHLRSKYGGTVIHHNDSTYKVDTRTDSTLSAGVYPSWHPSGRFVAFSVNQIVQLFHALPDKKIEVVDTLSDIILYDVNHNLVIRSDKLSSPDRLETMPSWSPDGKTLYFCSAPRHDFSKDDKPKYDLCRVSFDPENSGFGEPEILIAASEAGYSTSFPRVSPDGRTLVFCRADYGSFTIWHPESDLYMMDLNDLSVSKADINSNRTESYHSWSSDGRWMVFSSRRIDGLYTRLYLSYFDEQGKWHKPFLIPQRSPHSNRESLKSFNVPELISEKIPFNPRGLNDVVHSAAKSANFKHIR